MTPRREARSRQILDAAAERFRESGFHAASMADIAACAGMSVGHIYRYFAAKEDIVAAVVAANVADARSRFAEIEGSPEGCRAMLSRVTEIALDMAADPDQAGLFIEVRAEARREPRIAALLRAADTEIAEIVRNAVGRATGLDPASDEAADRAELLMTLYEGAMLRAAAGLDVGDRASATAARALEPLLVSVPPVGVRSR